MINTGLVPKKYAEKEKYINAVRKVLQDRNFDFILPPVCEHHSIYENSRYSDDIVKFMFNNDLIILRPDFTPSIAKMVNSLSIKKARIGYVGEVFRKRENEIVELTQCGTEFIGDEADEVSALKILCECIEACEIKDYSIEIGHSGIYRYIKNKLNLNELQSQQLNKIICSKSLEDITAYCDKNNVDASMKKLLVVICNFYNDEEQLNEAVKYINDQECIAQIKAISDIYSSLNNNRISIDLGMVKDFDYYTGIIFEAFVDGASSSVASGGRYDSLIKAQDENIAALGFGIDVDNLMKAGNLA